MDTGTYSKSAIPKRDVIIVENNPNLRFMRVEDDCFESEKILFGLIDFAIRLKPYLN